MKAALIQPPVFWTTTPPLGITYLAGELRSAGHAAALFDFNIELCATDAPAYAQVRRIVELVGHDSPLRLLPLAKTFEALRRACPVEWRLVSRLADDWAERTLASDPDLVGLSIHEDSLLPALLIASRIRDLVGPGRPRLIVGGPEAVFVQHDPRPIAGGVLDGAVVGEGEGPLRELLRRVVSGEIDLDGGLGDMPLPGALTRSRDGELLDGTLGAPLVDIHTIALPSFDGLPLDLYNFARTLPILGTRGCPAKCTFCFETVMWARFRLRTVESIVAEVKARLAEYGAPLTFRFNDSLLNGDLNWLARLAERLIEEDVRIKWHGNARIHPRMDRAYLDRLAEAGLTGFLYGVESGSDKILRRMKKGVNAADIPRVLRATHEAGIWTHGFFILGFPGETDIEALQTLDLLLDGLDNLDSLVFHDFALPEELAEYVNFAGRVAMDDPSIVVSGKLHLQSNVAAVRPWMQTFLAGFLEFAHSYGYLHWHPLGAAETRAVLALHRKRWQESATLARARAALIVARCLLAELHDRALTAYAEAVQKAGNGRELRVLRRDAADPIERTLALALDASESQRSAVASELAAGCAAGAVPPDRDELLSLLALHLDAATAHRAERPIHHEHLAPEGFR
jgi:pyruvate-formate lyase-activating enzyme